MKIFLTFLAAIFVSFAAQAQSEFGLSAGIRSGQAETDLQGATLTGKTGFQVGALTWLPIYRGWSIRTGFLYSQRPSMLSNTASGDVDIAYSYFDVPVTPFYRFSDFAGIFGGPVLAFNQSKEVTCSSKTNCAAPDVKSFLVPLEIGLDFRFAPLMGGEVYFEYVSGSLSANVFDMKTVGANFLFFFE
jgi:hypothetical protein